MHESITPPARSATSSRPSDAQPHPKQSESPIPCRISEPFVGDLHVELAERSLLNFSGLRRLALRVTDARDWTDVGGRPYLNSSGSLKVAAVLGVSLTGLRVEAQREILEGKEVLRFVARTTARFLGREVDVEGVSSSDDPFFSRKDGRALPLSEVNLNSVRKKAVTNAQSRAVRAIIGLGGLTWQEVRAAGVSQDRVAQVTHARRPERPGNGRTPPAGAARATAPAPAAPAAVGAAPAAPAPGAGRQAPPAPAVGPAAKAAPAPRAAAGPAVKAALGPARTRLKNMLTDIASLEEAPFERVLRRYTEFVGSDGKARWAESVDGMSEAWAERSLAPAERDWRAVVPWSAEASQVPALVS